MDYEEYRKRIIEMLGKIEDEKILKKIYDFLYYLYLHNT